MRLLLRRLALPQMPIGPLNLKRSELGNIVQVHLLDLLLHHGPPHWLPSVGCRYDRPNNISVKILMFVTLVGACLIAVCQKSLGYIGIMENNMDTTI